MHLGESSHDGRGARGRAHCGYWFRVNEELPCNSGVELALSRHGHTSKGGRPGTVIKLLYWGQWGVQRGAMAVVSA
eukprot:684360-Rhodomonas_salina.2